MPSKRIASATRLKAAGLHAEASPAAISSAHRPNPCNACSAVSRRGRSMGFCSASQALSNCSMDHAASPNALSPTIRELPLSVWNARRNVVCSLRSPGSLASACADAMPVDTTSRASSRKISSSSSSTSGSRTCICTAGASPSSAAPGAARMDVSGSDVGGSWGSWAVALEAVSVSKVLGAGATGTDVSARRGTTSGKGTAARSTIFCATESWSASVSDRRVLVLPTINRSSPISSS